MRLRLIGEIVSVEMRKAFSYRFDFWFNFIFAALGKVALSYFLWRSIFDFTKSDQIRGMTFHQIMIYFVLAFFVDSVVRSAGGKMGFLSREIYDGSLSRFLLYPVPLLGFKFWQMMVAGMVGLIQMFMGLAFVALLGAWPEAPALHLEAFVMGLLALVPGVVLYFMIVYAIELIAFWADNVWSLLVMLRFISGFLGGVFLPVALFPEWAQKICYSLPFYYIVGQPIECFLGRITWMQFGSGLAMSLGWTLGLWFIAERIFRRGLLKFTGVGI